LRQVPVVTPPPGTTGTGPKSRLCKECPAPAAEASGRMLDKLEEGLLREPIIGFGTEPSQKALVPVRNRPPWMFQYPVVGNPWQPSAVLGAPSEAVSGGLYPTSQDPLDSDRELLSGFKDSMKRGTETSKGVYSNCKQLETRQPRENHY
jgi:hypothetical protein